MSASIPVRDSEILELFDRELKQLEYYRPVRLVKSAAVTVLLSMGTMKRTRVTVLPNREFTQQELEFIFRHEIHHIQRGDVSNKIFFAFCQALCWFNPLIWVATRKASDDLELSCDIQQSTGIPRSPQSALGMSLFQQPDAALLP